MVGKNYHVEKNKHLFFAHYLICLIMFFDVFNDYFLGRISIFLGRISNFLGRISKWGRGGGNFGFLVKYTPLQKLVASAKVNLGFFGYRVPYNTIFVEYIYSMNILSI